MKLPKIEPAGHHQAESLVFAEDKKAAIDRSRLPSLWQICHSEGSRYDIISIAKILDLRPGIGARSAFQRREIIDGIGR